MSDSNSSRTRRPRSSQVCDEHTTENVPNRTQTIDEKVSQIAQLLHGWGLSFAQLVRHWIKHNSSAGGRDGRRNASKRVDILRALFTDDADATFKAIRNDSVMLDVADMAKTYLIQEMRTEFAELQRRSIFGKWKTEEDSKLIDLSMAGKELIERAPLFTDFMTKLALNTKSGGNQGYLRQEEEGYLVMVASILLLKCSRNNANRFARILGLYLQGTGVKRRAIEVLDGLGITECYRTLDNSKKELSIRSEVCI